MIALVFVAACALAADKDHLRYGPEPHWVVRLDPGSEPIPAGQVSDGIYYALIDEQVRVKDRSVERYERIVRRVVGTGGLESASEVRANFDPSYQTLTIHHVVVHRGEQRINGLRKDAVKLIQDEPEQSARIYNGRLTALLFVEDVRDGDAVDFAYSVSGENPVLGDKFTDETYLAGSYPTGRRQYRLVWPRSRPIQHRVHGMAAFDPQVKDLGEERELVWRRDTLPKVALEDRVPIWHAQIPWLQISSFESWAEVGKWASGLFREEGLAPSPELDSEIRRWSSEKDPESRLLAATRFVQRDVRYLGIEMGRNSYEPNDPSKVFERRFGDCKDKSHLLALALRGLGIDAHAALVSTRHRRSLDRLLPSSTVFDHAIVAAEIAGKTIFIDATDSISSGGFGELARPPFERALIISPKSTALVTMPDRNAINATDVEEIYEVKDYNSPVRFTVRSKFTGSRADYERMHLGEISREDYARESLNYYAKRDPKIIALEPPIVNDDAATNTITVEERYQIDEFWEGVHRDFYAYTLDDALRPPSILLRQMPLSVVHPQQLHHKATVRLPDGWDIEDEHHVIDGDAFVLTANTGYRNRVLTLEYDYRSKRDHLLPADVEKHVHDAERARSELDYGIAYRMTGSRGSKSGSTTTMVMMMVLLVVLLGGKKFFESIADRPARARKAQFKKKFVQGEGESPDVPIVIPDAESLPPALARQKCEGCSKKETLLVQSTEELVLGDEKVFVARLRCTSCSREARTYFAVQAR